MDTATANNLPERKPARQFHRRPKLTARRCLGVTEVWRWVLLVEAISTALVDTVPVQATAKSTATATGTAAEALR